jgi:hypothetical protein
MEFVDGTVVALPWTTTNSTDETVFVHCSAGAFHYTKQTGPAPKVFQPNRIVINDIYGTPGFCFNGAFIGYVETLQGLSDDEKNDFVYLESDGDDDGGGGDSHGAVDIDETTKLLGPSGGNADMSLIQGYAKRLSNLRKWIYHPEICDWLVHENRLFNLGSLTKDELVSLVETTYTQCKDLQVL